MIKVNDYLSDFLQNCSQWFDPCIGSQEIEMKKTLLLNDSLGALKTLSALSCQIYLFVNKIIIIYSFLVKSGLQILVE